MAKKKNRKPDRLALFFILMLAILVNVSVGFAQDSSPTPYPEKQILILIGPQYGLPMVQAITPAIVDTLTENGFSLDDIFVEFLDLHRHPGRQHRSNILALLETKLKDRSIGLIVAVNQGAVGFVAREGKDLLPGVPMLIPILEKLPEWEGEPRKLITLDSRLDVEGTLRYAMDLFPGTTRMLLIMGEDDHEAPFLGPISQVIDGLPKKLHTETTEDLPYEQMLERVATLPRDAIAFYGSYFRDITGRSFVPGEVAARVAETANRPVFAFRDMHIVQGLVGGSVTITSVLGKQAALIGLDYLAGHLGLALPVTSFAVPNTPLFDWRQLQRWGGDVDTLPADTIFLNRPPTLWSQHQEAVIIALASFVLLFILVVALLVAYGRQRTAIRKRKQAEKGLVESEALLSQSQEIAHIGSWELDVTTNKLYWSDEVYRIFGCEPQEFNATYEVFLDYIHPDDRAAVDDAYSRSVRDGIGSYEIEHRILRQDTGEIRYVYERCVHDRDDAGAVIRSIGMVQDATERKQTEKLTRESAERANKQRNLIAQLTFDDAIVNTSTDDALKILTSKLAATMQVDRVSVWLLAEDETTLRRLALYDAAPGLHSQVADLNTTDIPAYFEALRKDSQVDADDAQNDPRTKELTDDYLVPLQISSLLDSTIQQDGRLIGVLSVEHRGANREWHADEKSFLSAITNLVAQLFANARRKQAEENLRISETRYRSVIAVSNTGAWEFHRKQQYLWSSPEYFEMLGRNPDDHPMDSTSNLAENWINLIHPDDRKSTADRFTNYLDAGSIGMYESVFRMSHAGGSWVWIWSRGQTIRNPDGSVSDCTVGTHIDITERERLRKELIRLNAELESKVEQRTAQLQAANKELESFSYSVSHDLRAPLRHISGYVDLLNNRFGEALPEKAGHYLSEVKDSAQQMGALIDDLLQFSRTGRQELRLADMDMNAAVQEALEKLKADTEGRNILWTVAELPRVFGDYSLLRQVWTNLLENAVKYTGYKDEAKIEVGFTREAGRREFFVRDNGVGFDMQYAHKLFGVFQRLHSTTEFEGTGIGLASVQRIVHKHGGRVWAEGRPDEGASFYFTIDENPFDEGGTS